jgi:RHS repeat-associated protein
VGTETGDTNTAYAYGPSDSQTTQTGKTVREGTAPGSGTITEQHTFTYDVMGRMVSTIIDKTGSGGAVTTTTYQYNANGLRVSETTGSETRTYLFDLNNPTGFAQAIEEHLNGTLDKTYTLGHDVIAQHDSTNGLLHLLYDGHGSTRAVLNPAALVQRYAYDAYGVMLTGPGLTAASAALTSLLYSGEHTNANGTQYLRARWYDPSTGRFNRLDPFAGNASDPLSLHKYLYTHGNPVMGIDPSGRAEFTITGLLTSIAVGAAISGLDAYLAGKPAKEVAQAIFVGGVIGGLLYPVALTKYGLYAFASVGTVVGAYGTWSAIEEENYELAAFRGALTVLSAYAIVQQYQALRASLWDPFGIGSPSAVVDVELARLSWSQTTAGGRGRTQAISEFFLRFGYKNMDPIDVVRMPSGKLVTVDNTRPAVALKLENQTIPARIHNAADPLPKVMIDNGRFGPATTWGDAVTYRISQQAGGNTLPADGLPNPPRLMDGDAIGFFH